MENWTVVSWVVSLALAAWVYVDAQRRGDGKAGLWAFCAFCFPWVFGPIFVIFLRGRGMARVEAAIKVAEQLQRRHGATRTDPAQQASAIDAMAAEIAGAATPAARADLIRQVGRAWADAITSEIKPGGVATVRVLVESAAEATAKGDLAKAQEQMDKALSHVRGGARKHPGGRMILEGLAKALERGDGPGPRAEDAPRRKPRRAPSGELRPPAPIAPAPASIAQAPTPLVEPAAPRAEVPAFLASKVAPPEATTPGGGPVAPVDAPAPPFATAVADAAVAVVPVVVPPVAGLPADLAARFRAEPLDAFSARVSELAARWLAEVGDVATSVQRSYARVKLESAASAVYRGDFARAIAMADEAAALVPADGEAAATLRAGLRCAQEARALGA